MNKNFNLNKALKIRLEDRMESLDYYTWYFSHLQINDEIEKEISKERPLMSIIMKFINLPTITIRYFKHNIMLIEFYFCAKEIEYLKIKLGLNRKNIDK